MIAASLAVVLALAAPPGDVPEELASAIGAARAEAGSPPLDRRPELDAVAARRAREIAALPEPRRFEEKAPIEELLLRAGVADFLRARAYAAWQSGYADDAAAAVANWRENASNWRDALDADWGRVGFATARADDGALVIVAVLVEPSPEIPPADAVERAVLDAVNRERSARGLAVLAPDPRLAAAARAHSRDMLERGYFAHRTPEGQAPAARAAAAGIPFRRLAENIAQNVRVADPAAEAVKQWMTSPGHRENALDPEFTHTGVGVAIDATQRRLVFTQMFLRPPEPAGAK